MNKTWGSVFSFFILLFSAIAWAAPVPDTAPTTCYPVHADASSPIALIGSDLNPADRLVASASEVVPLSGSGAVGNMLQFKAGGHVLGFQPNKAYLAGLDHVLSVEFLGTPGVMPTSASTAPAAGSMTKAPALSTVLYQNLWNDINLMYESTNDGITESSYRVAPGGDVSKIRLRYNVPVESQADGSLKFKFDSGFLSESSPVAWQEIGEKHVPVTVAFRVSDGEVGFSVGKYDRGYPLIIDPAYAWHTFYGSDNNQGNGIAVDSSGNVYVTGDSYATWNGPTGQSPLNAFSGSVDVFVLKLNSSGAYQWHTFYGSSSYGNSIAVDGSGNVYVTGHGKTWNGPTGQSPLNAYSGSVEIFSFDIFVLKLNSSGAYQWHTFYGSSSGNRGSGIAVDSSGNVYVTGYSYATWNGPTGQSPLNAFGGTIFVLKLNSSGAYQWHTFYGSVSGQGKGIAVDSSGNVYVTGYGGYATWNGPTGQSPLKAYSGSSDIFVLKLNSSGAYQWHTFYGSFFDDQGNGIAVDSSGNVYVTGYSHATWNGPTGQSPVNAFSGNYDIFVLKLSSSGAYQWHTFYGSSSKYDESKGIAVDGSNVYVTGYGYATWNGPTGQSPLNAFSGSIDVFVLKLSSSGAYQWHTFYGSSDDDGGFGIAADGSGNVYVTGLSGATWNGPAGQSPLNAYSGNSDIFVLKILDGIGLTGLGWNLISLPQQPSNTAISTVLGSISGKYSSTWAYQNDAWKVFDPANPGLSDLSTMEAGWGYWLDMTEAATLSVTGTEPSKTINLITGWNLVGYNSSNSQNITDALASIAGNVISVWAYKNDTWQVYDPTNPGSSDLTTMSPGYGYWIKTNGACTWTLP